MSTTRPRRIYRQVGRESVVVNASGPLTPKPVEGRIGRIIVRAMTAYGWWRRRHLTPEKLERARHEQEIALRHIKRFPEN